jgi:O-antigen/teichoic acid export membrane protein
VGGINLAWTPHYFRLMQADPNPEARIIKIVSLYLALIGGVCMAGILFVGEVVYILMPSIYYGAVIFVAPILFGYLLLGLYYFSVSPIFHYAKTLILPLLTGFAAMLNILLNLWLIPYFGAIAAAWTTTITQGVLFLLVFFVGRRFQRIDYPFGRYGLVILIILISTIAAPHLRGFEGWLLLVKTSLLVFYSVVAYLLLIVPNGTARQFTL